MSYCRFPRGNASVPKDHMKHTHTHHDLSTHDTRATASVEGRPGVLQIWRTIYLKEMWHLQERDNPIKAMRRKLPPQAIQPSLFSL